MKRYQIGAGDPVATVLFKRPAVLTQLITKPSLAFEEAYMNGDIEVTGELAAIMQGFHQSNIQLLPQSLALLQKTVRRTTIPASRAKKNAQHHYDIGNDFYQLWLDESRTYSCAYFENGNETLHQAQIKKLDLICRKLHLEPGQTLLDIGAGWGSLLFHAVNNYGVKATGITPAKEQAAFIRQESKRQGIEESVTVLEDDWRSLTGTYDRIVSVGMFEHVGAKHYDDFFRQWYALLAEDGISLLHTISRQVPGEIDPWLNRYIFPDGSLPSLTEITSSIEKVNLAIFRVENLRPHYAKTLAHWRKNFERVKKKVAEMFGDQFVRMWRLYLIGSEAAFRYGQLELYQLELYGPKAKWPTSRRLPKSKIDTS